VGRAWGEEENQQIFYKRKEFNIFGIINNFGAWDRNRTGTVGEPPRDFKSILELRRFPVKIK
jgi:hypothetical protein